MMTEEAVTFLENYKVFSDRFVVEMKKNLPPVEQAGLNLEMQKWGTEWQPIYEALSAEDQSEFLLGYQKITREMTARL